jgi:hypothetical protein
MMIRVLCSLPLSLSDGSPVKDKVKWEDGLGWSCWRKDTKKRRENPFLLAKRECY